MNKVMKNTETIGINSDPTAFSIRHLHGLLSDCSSRIVIVFRLFINHNGFRLICGFRMNIRGRGIVLVADRNFWTVMHRSFPVHKKIRSVQMACFFRPLSGRSSFCRFDQ